MGCIILPVLVKNFEMSSPLSASRATDSAEGALRRLRVVFIELLFLLCRFPKSYQMVVFATFICSDFENQRIKLLLYPTYRPILLRQIRTLIEVVGSREYLFSFFETNPAFRICA